MNIKIAPSLSHKLTQIGGIFSKFSIVRVGKVNPIYCVIRCVGHLEKIERTWFMAKFNESFAVFSKNASTPLQITLLTKPTGIYLIISYNRHITEKNDVSFFWKKSPNIKNYPLLTQNQWFCVNASSSGHLYRVVDGALPISWVSWSGELPVGMPANRPLQTTIIKIQSAVLATVSE